jgi:hypothetical protein
MHRKQSRKFSALHMATAGTTHANGNSKKFFEISKHRFLYYNLKSCFNAIVKNSFLKYFTSIIKFLVNWWGKCAVTTWMALHWLLKVYNFIRIFQIVPNIIDYL